MTKWLFFITFLTVGTVFYHYPSLFTGLKDRIPVWLGMVDNGTLYRWQDHDGQWHVSDQAPQGKPYDKVRVRYDTREVKVSQSSH